MLIFPVGGFLHKPQGSREEYQVNEAIQYPDEKHLKLSSKVRGSVRFTKLPHEINVQMIDFKLSVECPCSLCLKTYHQNIEIPFAEREFSIDLSPKDIMPGEDLLQINRDRNEIDLSEMVRQEIILHFPTVPVCSENCEGLCPTCGVNRNEKICQCPQSESAEANPFHKLKNLFPDKTG